MNKAIPVLSAAGLAACTPNPARDGGFSAGEGWGESADPDDPQTGTGGPSSTSGADSGTGEGSGSGGPQPTSGTGGGGTDGDPGDEIRLDIGGGSGSGSGGNGEGGNGEDEECVVPHVPCDESTDDPFRALGLNCPGELPVSVSTAGSAQGLGIRSSLGSTSVFDPREGSAYVVLSSGYVSEIDSETPGNGIDELDNPTFCNRDHDGASVDPGPLDPDAMLPSPIDPVAVAGDCLADPSLVGTGDCSRTIEAQWRQGATSHDYAELRFSVTVPPDVTSFSYDFAFFTTEYPSYHGDVFNDIYIGWLESSRWTGNISFDQAGNPISLNAAFLEFEDDAGNVAELGGSCMKYHAGTNWLTTTAPVTPGETITVVFAVMDLADSILDSFVLLDNFRWGCDGGKPPGTGPVG